MRAPVLTFRRLLPVMLAAGLALTSCEHCKDRDPRPKGKCGSNTTPPPAPGGNN